MIHHWTRAIRCFSLTLISLLALSGASLWAQDGNASAEGTNWKLTVEGGPDGGIVKAVPKANPKGAAKLCETVSAATTRVFLSPDDDIAVIESGSASLGTSFSLFLLTEGTEYLELTDWDVTEAVELARKKAGAKAASKPSLHFVTWSADGRAALVRWGGGAEAWFAVVDFDARKVSASLERLNKKGKAQ